MKRLSLSWLNKFGEIHPSNVAIISNRKLTYSELNEKVTKRISAIVSAGVSKNSRVALIQKNSVDFIVNLFALWKLGATPIPINFRLPVSEIKEQIGFISPALIITDDAKIKDSLKKLNFPIRSRFNSGKNSKAELPTDKISLNDTALLMFTSGSASKPKCVELTFRNLIYGANNVNNLIGAKPDDKWLASLPFYHIGGFSIIVRALIRGSAIVLPKELSTSSIIQSVSKHSPDYLSLVPTMLKNILAEKENVFTKTKAIFLGGSAIGDQLVSTIVKKKLSVIIVYGSTETASMVTASTSDDYKRFPRAAGRPIGENKILISGKRENALSVGKIGDVVVSSQAVAKGYFNNPKLTKAFFTNAGYVTNDVGYVNKEGLLFIKRRKDAVIISGGENIDLDALQKEILKLKSISDAYLFGLPDEKWGTALAAAIVTKDKKKCAAEIEKKLKGIKKPKILYFVKELPKTELGKVNKSVLLKILGINEKRRLG
ncbi:MAG: acyl--CoA ligase [Chlorobi bacterium]|nr:acyl--CoA ligase [Chlorobiota bacterium]